MDDVTKRLIESALEPSARVHQEQPQAGRLMVTMNTPEGPNQVPVEIGIFMLLDLIATSLLEIKRQVVADDPPLAATYEGEMP